METPKSTLRGYRFGAFELEFATGELRKSGVKVRLQDQPLAALALLLENRETVVTREQVCKRLWPQDTFVDFEKGVNTAIYNLREALGDEAESPRYVQTVPKKGYRFIAQVEEWCEDVPEAPPQRRRWLWPLAAVALILLGAAVAWFGKRDFAATPTGKVSVAVLMFQNLSGDEKQEYFSRGQTEELITQLSRMNPDELGVIGFATSSALPGKEPIAIGRDFKVQYVVVGSASRTGDRVHINARLLETKGGRSVWANTYDRAYSPTTVEEVASDIAQGIQIQLKPRTGNGPPNPEAYDALLRARYFMNRRTDEDLKKSIAYLLIAVEKDPNYALAHAYLADFYNLMGFYSLEPPREAYARAKAEAMRALELDPNLAAAHASLADLSYINEWDWTAAQREFERAIALNPNYAPAHQWYGMFLASQGKYEAGIAEVKKALQIEPLALVINADLGLCYYYARQYDQAFEQYQKTLNLDGKYSLTHNWMGMTLVKLKRYDEAIAHFQQAVEYSGGSQGSYGLLAYGYGMAGRKPEARSTLETLLKLSDKQYLSPAYVAVAYIGLGDRDKVFEWADKSYQDRAALMVRLKVEPVVDSVRDDPRFPKLLAKVGLR